MFRKLGQKVIKLSIKKFEGFNRIQNINQMEEQNQIILDQDIQIHLNTNDDQLNNQNYYVVKNIKKSLIDLLQKLSDNNDIQKIMKKQFILYVGYNQDSQYVELHIQRQHPQTL
ncbi:hypothetical protein pb186bvf_014268 [Paramecium bursaria]